jgi:hypothetical protein
MLATVRHNQFQPGSDRQLTFDDGNNAFWADWPNSAEFGSDREILLRDMLAWAKYSTAVLYRDRASGELGQQLAHRCLRPTVHQQSADGA